jgi:hypothetical protein
MRWLACFLAMVAVLAACGDPTEQSAAPAGRTDALRSELDGPVTTDAWEKHAEYDPMPGRLGKLPASFLFRQTFSADGAHQLRIMTICPTDGDTGMVVHDPALNRTYYNDDADGLDQFYVGSNGKGSYIDLGPREASARYTVYVFSKRRATSKCQIRFSTVLGTPSYQNYDGNGWKYEWITPASAGYYREFGGSLVKTGPMRPGDFLEVQTAPTEDWAFATHMALFQIPRDTPNTAGAFVMGAPLYSGRQSRSDLDPRISVGSSAAFMTDNTYALVGKVDNFWPQAQPFSVRRVDVEVMVDLIRGPLNEGLLPPFRAYPALTCTSTACTGAWRTLPQGRYHAWIYTKAATPVGHIARSDNATSGRGNHLMRENAGIWFNTSHESVSTYEENGGCYGEFDANARFGWRGVPNQNALSLHVDYATNAAGTQYVTRSTRVIPLGAIGGRDGDGWNLFMVELRIDSPNAATYPFRLRTSSHAPGIGLSFFPEWRYQRNIDASELKVVTWNALFKPAHSQNKFKNAADLFATRGTVWNVEPGDNPAYPTTYPTFRVEERADQGPFQWDADVVGLQEVMKDGSDSEANINSFSLADTFNGEASLRGSLSWNYVRSKGEQWDFPCGFGWLETCYGGGLNPLFVSSYVTPASGMFFSPAAKNATHVVNGSAVKNCDDMGGSASAASCHLAGDRAGDIAGMKSDGDEGCVGTGAGYSDCYDLRNYAAAGKVAARKYSGTPTITSDDRPIAVFNVHLEHNYPDSDDRYMEMQSLIDVIKSMLAAEPQAFNHGVPNDLPPNTNPYHYQNRIIIVGDTNIDSHACGEHYVLTRLLRENFGYAVDVAMAVNGSIEGRFGMHDGPYDPSTLVPIPFRSFANWQGLSDAVKFSQAEYPFWARTFRGKTSREFASNSQDGERHDLVWLVGKGWAYDDAVLSYQIMGDSTRVTPTNPTGRGVEMWAGQPGDEGPFDDGTEGSVPDNSPLGYAPNHPLYGTSGTQRGKPALHSDHRPVGARLRVFVR